MIIMAYKVAFNGIEEDKIGKSKSLSLPISTKHSVELARAIKGMKLNDAYAFLKDVIALKRAVAFRRYISDRGHKKGGIGPGRFPVKTAENFKKALKSAESNAAAKGLDTDSLFIYHIAADKAASRIRAGRHGGRSGKNTNLEIILMEKAVERTKTEKRKQKSEKTNLSKKEAEKKDSKNKKTTQRKEESNKEEPKKESKKSLEKSEEAKSAENAENVVEEKTKQQKAKQESKNKIKDENKAVKPDSKDNNPKTNSNKSKSDKKESMKRNQDD